MWKQVMSVLAAALLCVTVMGQEVSTRVVSEVRVAADPVLSVVELTTADGATKALALTGPALLDPATGSNPREADQTLTTTIQDPGNPDEPWVVVTYKKPGESLAAFIKRHRDMVAAVRDSLGQ